MKKTWRQPTTTLHAASSAATLLEMGSRPSALAEQFYRHAKGTDKVRLKRVAEALRELGVRLPEGERWNRVTARQALLGLFNHLHKEPLMTLAAREILSAVLVAIAQQKHEEAVAALQDAEEMGGPEGEDYVTLMEAVRDAAAPAGMQALAGDAATRITVYKESDGYRQALAAQEED